MTLEAALLLVSSVFWTSVPFVSKSIMKLYKNTHTLAEVYFAWADLFENLRNPTLCPEESWDLIHCPKN